MVVALEELKRPTVILKFVELILGLICIGLCEGNVIANTVSKMEVVHGTFIGFFILGIVVLASHFMEQPLNNRLLMVVAAVAAFMYLVSGALVLEFYTDVRWDNAIAAGIMALINCLVYVADVGFSYRASF